MLPLLFFFSMMIIIPAQSKGNRSDLSIAIALSTPKPSFQVRSFPICNRGCGNGILDILSIRRPNAAKFIQHGLM